MRQGAESVKRQICKLYHDVLKAVLKKEQGAVWKSLEMLPQMTVNFQKRIGTKCTKAQA